MEVLIARPDGTWCLRLAHYSYRRGPIGEWLVGGVALDNVNGVVIAKGEEARKLFEQFTEENTVPSGDKP